MALTLDSKSMFAAIENRVDTLRGATPVAWENKVFTPTGVAYVRVNRIPFPTRTPSFGGQHARETGILQVTPTFPAGSGNGAAHALADVIRNGFPPGSTYTKLTVTVHIEAWGSIAPAIEDPVWYRVPVSIPYRCDYLG